MEIVPVIVYYDFASTFCYVTHVVVERIRPQLEELGIQLIWQPMDLTEMAGWSRGDAFSEEIRGHVVEAARELGVAARMPDVWMDSRFASGIALGLEPDLEREWRCGVWQTAFESQVPLDESEALVALARRCGLEWPPAPPQELLQRVVDSTAAARASGVVGVPTFVLDGMPVGGIQDEETMVDFLGRFAQRYREVGSQQSVS